MKKQTIVVHDDDGDDHDDDTKKYSCCEGDHFGTKHIDDVNDGYSDNDYDLRYFIQLRNTIDKQNTCYFTLSPCTNTPVVSLQVRGFGLFLMALLMRSGSKT